MPAPRKPKVDENAVPPGCYNMLPRGAPIPWSDRWDVERTAYVNGWPVHLGGLGRQRHFMHWFKRRWPEFIHTEWSEWIFEALTDDERAVKFGRQDVYGLAEPIAHVRVIALAGCASSGKTYAATAYACAFWDAAPSISAVVLCSTTKDMARKRIWPIVTSMYVTACDCVTGRPYRIGRLVESRKTIMHQDPDTGRIDEKHSISLVALKGGADLEAAVTHVRGVHVKRMCLVIDEATVTPEALLAAIPNLRKGCKELTIIVIDNCGSHLDPHGLVCEPRDGWSSVSVDTEEWPTKGVPQWQIEPGWCLHLDGENPRRSPNIKARRTKHSFIYTWEDHLSVSGDTPEAVERRNTVAYWKYNRGFWSPEGLADRLFSEVMFEKYGARASQPPFQWLTRSRRIAFLDQAFGGDQCKFVWGRLGDVAGGLDEVVAIDGSNPASVLSAEAAGSREAVQIEGQHVIQVSATDNNERDYQIARQAIAWCRELGVDAEAFGDDATGIGRGVHAILYAEWSPQVQRVEFGGGASERPSHTADARPAHEVYANAVTEYWYAVHAFLVAGQLRGIYDDAVVQFCARPTYMAGRRHALTPKDECLALMKGRSPDDADAIAGLVEVARRLGLECAGRAARARDDGWTRMVADASRDAESDDARTHDDKEPAPFVGEAAIVVDTPDMCDLTL